MRNGDLWEMRKEHEQSGSVQQVWGLWVQHMPEGCREFLSLLHHRQARKCAVGEKHESS